MYSFIGGTSNSTAQHRTCRIFRGLETEMVLDRISNLPSEIIVGDILSRLTLKEAVRTSFLSSQWRHKWAMLPDLELDQLKASENHTVVSIIDQILLAHIGPIRKFKLMKQPVACSDVGRWMLHLSRNSCSSIKEFAYNSVHNSIETKHEMPLCIYSFHRMIRLELWWCVLKPPSSTFRGFSSLKDLSLTAVDVAQDVLENMIRCCPLLERLILACPHNFDHFKIDAPNLEWLFLDNGCEDLSIMNTSKLTGVILRNSYGRVSSSSTSLLNFLGLLHHIQCLKIGLNYFAGGGILLQKLRNPLPNLKFLEMHIKCHDLKEILTALCLWRSSPALQKLVIMIDGLGRLVDGAANSWLDDNHSCSLTELRHVEIHFIEGLEDELDLIQLLLSSSPVLEKMTVIPGPMVDPHTSPELRKKLQRFRRASPNLELKLRFLDWSLL